MNLFLWYDEIGDSMANCEFEKEEKYKLFRSVKEILHPTISKKNISDYKIIIRDDLLAVRIFYPKKVTNLERVIFYFHGESKITNCKGKYSDIAGGFSKDFNQLVLSIDVSDLEERYQLVYRTFYYIYQELLEAGIQKTNVSLMGDSTGGSIVLSMISQMNHDKITASKMILFYPVLSGEYYGKTTYKSIAENNTIDHDLVKKLKNFYKKKGQDNPMFFHLLDHKKYSYPKTLIVIGGVDPLVDEAYQLSQRIPHSEIKLITFANHGFLGSKDKEIKKECYDIVCDFLEEND